MISRWRLFHQRGYTQVRQSSCRSTKTAKNQQLEGRTVTCSHFVCPEHPEQCQNKSRQGVWKSDYVSCLFSFGRHWEAENLLWKDQVPGGCSRERLRTQECSIWPQSGFPGSCASFSGCREPWILQSHTTVLSLIELHRYPCFASQLILYFSLQRRKVLTLSQTSTRVGLKPPYTLLLTHSQNSLKIGGYIKSD